MRATHGAGARTPCRSSPRCPHRGSLRTSAQLSGAFELEGVLGKDIPGPGSWLGVFFFFLPSTKLKHVTQSTTVPKNTGFSCAQDSCLY